MNRLLSGTALCAIAMIGAAGAARAETAPGAADPGDPNAIVVTAQRREQSAQDVGIALSVVGHDDLIRRGITNVNDLQQATPNLQIEPAFGSGQAQFRIRGVGFQDYATNNSPTVGVYVNEVAYPVPAMTQGLIFDIARVEVLRGPQGTLYGRNTTGGAINFVTNKPTSETHAGASVEYGRFNAVKAEGYVSGAVAKGLNFRLAMATEQGGGFQHNRDTGEELGDAKKFATRGLLSYDSGTGFTALLDAHYGQDHSENTGLYLLSDYTTPSGVVIPADKDHTATGWNIPATLVRDAGLDPYGKPGRRNSSWGASFNQSYDFGPVKFTSITSYDHLIRREYGDYDATSLSTADVYFGSRVSVVSEEARVSSNGSGPFTWVAGVYYSHQQLDEAYDSDFDDNYGTYGRVSYSQVVKSLAGFAQGEYALTSKLSLTAGVRYEDETRNLNGFTSSFGGALALKPTDERAEMKPWSGKVAVQYKPITGLLVYASASKGVKSGGFTVYNYGNSTGILPFKPERLFAYEAGFKSNLSRAIEINGAAFYYDYRDQQVLDAVCGTNGYVGKISNAKKSRIWGLEVEAVLRPIHGLSISPYASYTRGKYLDFQGIVGCDGTTPITTDKSGERMPFLSTTVGTTVAYEIPAGAYVITPSATVSYRSRAFTWLNQLRSGADFSIPPYALVNADLTLAPANGPWSVSVWGRNIFNKQYDLTRNFFTEANIAQPGRPASYGVRLAFNY